MGVEAMLMPYVKIEVAKARRQAFREAGDMASVWWDGLPVRERCYLESLQDLKDRYRARADEHTHP